MNEIQFQGRLNKAANSRDWRVQRNHDSRKSVGRGYPDLHLARRGDTLLWEVKMPDGVISGPQKEWFYQFMTPEYVMAQRVDFIYPVDWDYAIRTLDNPRDTLYEWETQRLPGLLHLLRQWEKERGNTPTKLI